MHIVGQIIRIHVLRHPVWLSEQRSEALNGAIEDKLASFDFESIGLHVLDYVLEGGEVGRVDPCVSVDIDGELISKLMIDSGLYFWEEDILNSGDSIAEVVIGSLLDLIRC